MSTSLKLYPAKNVECSCPHQAILAVGTCVAHHRPDLIALVYLPAEISYPSTNNVIGANSRSNEALLYQWFQWIAKEEELAG